MYLKDDYDSQIHCVFLASLMRAKIVYNLCEVDMESESSENDITPDKSEKSSDGPYEIEKHDRILFAL